MAPYSQAATSCRSFSTLAVLLMITANAAVGLGQQDEFLTTHNSARASVGVAPLVWDSTVAGYAQNYGQSRSSSCLPLVHSGGPYGENLYWAPWSASPTDAVNYWVSEKQYYDYASNTCAAPPDKECGHYTQVVWANSARLGCASIACDNNGGTFIICSYDPPGNVEGQRPY